MTTSPIAENMERERNGAEYYGEREAYPGEREESERDRHKNKEPRYYDANTLEEIKGLPDETSQADGKSRTDFMSGLLDAQQKFISAQYQFLRDANVQAYLVAQRDMIQHQTMVLCELGVFK